MSEAPAPATSSTPESKRKGSRKESKEKDNAAPKSEGSPLFRAKKAAVGKMATSALGKSLLKKVLDDESNEIMRGLKRVVEKQSDVKKAKEIQNSIIRMMVKAQMQIDRKALKEADFYPLDRPLRKAFRVVVKLNTSWKELNDEQRKAQITRVGGHLKEVEDIVVKLMDPYLKPKNKEKLRNTIEFLSKEDFLLKIWTDDTVKEHRDKFCKTMEKYLKQPSKAPKVPKENKAPA